MSETIIEITDLTMKFSNNTVLDHINLTVEKGKVIGIEGRNGSGKSVLFKIIVGFLKPTKGTIRVFNQEIFKEVEFPRDCGIVFPNDFLPHLNGYKNLKLLSYAKNQINDYIILQTLEKVGLNPNCNIKYKHYSTGMKQKLRIAQALMESPKLLILDEPFNGLDLKSYENIKNIINDFKNQGGTVLLSSHIKDDLEKTCDKIYSIQHLTLKEVSHEV